MSRARHLAHSPQPSMADMALRFTSAADMIHLLPPEARMLVAQFAPHPAAAALWTSRRWLRLWGVANGWYADWQDRRDLMIRDGLPAHIEGAALEDNFLSVHMCIDEAYLVRPHIVRGFKLHVSIGFTTDWGDGIAAAAVENINSRWRDRHIVLKIAWMGSGGAAFLAEDDALARDYDVAWLYARGWYSDRGMHVSL